MMMRKCAFASPVPAHRGVRFSVGRDARGMWVVSDRDGLVGGCFTDRASAVHFAVFESDHTPGAVCCLPDDQVMPAPGDIEGARQAPLKIVRSS